MSTVQRFYRPGQFLFREGDPSHCMFLIKKGTIAVRKTKGNAYIELGRLYANEVLGELSFFDRMPRSAAAIALTEVEVLEIKFEQLDKMYSGVPDYMKTIIASVADRLRKANEMIRRLQKNVVTETGAETPSNPDEPSTADALAAAAGLSTDSADSTADAFNALDGLTSEGTSTEKHDEDGSESGA